MTYKHLQRVSNEMVKLDTPYKTEDGWVRCAETHRYFLDYNETTADQRIVDKKTGKVEWSYYGDFYTG